MRKPRGTIYLIHFHRPYKHARHYLGWTANLPYRLERHAAGAGARLMEVIKGAKIGWTLARTWLDQTKDDERALKNRKASPRLCPICTGGVA